jgi:hypothetical protein
MPFARETDREKEMLKNLFKRSVWYCLYAALGLCLIFIGIAFSEGGFSRLGWKYFLTSLGVIPSAALILIIEKKLAVQHSRLRIPGILAVLLSQIVFLLLVWSELRQYHLFWRIWWMAMAPSLFITHLVIVRSSELLEKPVKSYYFYSIAAAGVWFVSVGLRRDLFSMLPIWWLVAGIIPIMAVIAGTIWMFINWVRQEADHRRLQKNLVISVLVLSHLGLTLLGFYIGRVFMEAKLLKRSFSIKTIPPAIQSHLKDDLYSGQAEIATWMGDTRLVERDPFITQEQIDQVKNRICPGDIILERRNWYLSNPFLPGFWPHAALYVGNSAELSALKKNLAPPIVSLLDQFLGIHQSSNSLQVVVEAVSEGVILNSLGHSIQADYVAVLRPRLTTEQKKQAVITALENLQKPYDFNFDFEDTSKLVCTQLVYLSYRPWLDFPLIEILGRKTLPANNIAKMYVHERENSRRKLDFVLFLDANHRLKQAFFSNDAEFCRSIMRPRALIE